MLSLTLQVFKGENGEADQSVPITWAYNHHYCAFLASSYTKMTQVPVGIYPSGRWKFDSLIHPHAHCTYLNFFLLHTETITAPKHSGHLWWMRALWTLLLTVMCQSHNFSRKEMEENSGTWSGRKSWLSPPKDKILSCIGEKKEQFAHWWAKIEWNRDMKLL